MLNKNIVMPKIKTWFYGNLLPDVYYHTITDSYCKTNNFVADDEKKIYRRFTKTTI